MLAASAAGTNLDERGWTLREQAERDGLTIEAQQERARVERIRYYRASKQAAAPARGLGDADADDLALDESETSLVRVARDEQMVAAAS